MIDMENPTGNSYPDLVRSDLEGLLTTIRNGRGSTHATAVRSLPATEARALVRDVKDLLERHPVSLVAMGLGVGLLAGLRRS